MSSPSPMPDRMLKAEEAACLIGLTKSTVYDWIARGYLPHHRFGRTVRISAKDLYEYLSKSRVPPRLGE